MSYNHEYQQPTVGNAGCTYSKLDNTYACIGKGAAMMKANKMNQYVVPKLCATDGKNAPAYPPPYNTLQHGVSNGCGGHFNMSNAYPYAGCGTNNCKLTFTNRACNGTVHEQCKPKSVAPSTESMKQGFKFW